MFRLISQKTAPFVFVHKLNNRYPSISGKQKYCDKLIYIFLSSFVLLYIFINLRMFVDRDLNGNKIEELPPKIFSGIMALWGL